MKAAIKITKWIDTILITCKIKTKILSLFGVFFFALLFIHTAKKPLCFLDYWVVLAALLGYYIIEKNPELIFFQNNFCSRICHTCSYSLRSSLILKSLWQIQHGLVNCKLELVWQNVESSLCQGTFQSLELFWSLHLPSVKWIIILIYITR